MSIFHLILSGATSVQTVSIDLEGVKLAKVTFSGEGAVVTFISFCAFPQTSTPTSPPTGLRPVAPTAGKVKGTVYEDVNGNGVQDTGEPGIEGVDVLITDSTGETFTLTTDETGVYMAEVPPGPTVTDIDESTVPPGNVQTGGSDPSAVIVPSGGTATDSDGFQSTGKIKGVVFQDVNGNGSQDGDEAGIEGVDVVVTDSLGESITLTTDETGMYTAEVPVGATVTDIVASTLPDGAEQTAGSDPSTVVVPGGGTATDSDGFQFPVVEPTTSPTKSPTVSPGTPTAAPSPGGANPPTTSQTTDDTLPPSFEGTPAPTKSLAASPQKLELPLQLSYRVEQIFLPLLQPRKHFHHHMRVRQSLLWRCPRQLRKVVRCRASCSSTQMEMVSKTMTSLASQVLMW